jgi:hypothetical protein
MKTTRQTQFSPGRLGRRSDRGQVVALYAIAIPVMLMVMALALDGGKLFVSKIHAQNIADAAALASAQDLGPCSTGPPPAGTCDALTESTVRATVEADANTYSTNNRGPLVVGLCTADWYAENQAQRHIDPARNPSKPTGCYTWPYVSGPNPADVHWDKVEVRIRKPVDLSFARLVGFNNPAYPFARSVAAFQPALLVTTNPGSTVLGYVLSGQTHTYVYSGQTTTITDPNTTVVNTTTTSTFSGGTGGAAFLKSTDCASDPGGAALHWAGADSTLRSIIVNGGIDIQGANIHTSDHIWVGRKGTAGCVILGPGARVGQITGPFTPLNWPLPPPNPAPPVGCLDTGTNSISGGWVAGHPPGVYCYTSGALQISAKNTTFDGYSFFAPSIGISSNGMIFNPSLSCGTRKVLFDAYAGDFSMTGGGDTLNGDIYAPTGNIAVTGGGSFAGCGFMEAMKMNVGGNFAGYNGTGPGEGGGVTSTTQTTTTVIPGGTHTTTAANTTSFTTDPDTVVTGSTTPGNTFTATTGTDIGLGE